MYESGSPAKSSSLKRISAEIFLSPLFNHLYFDSFIVGL